MRASSRGLILSAIWSFTLFVSSAPLFAAQSQSLQGITPAKPSEITRIDLGKVSGEPGDSVSVPILFSPGRDVQVETVKLAITFDSTYIHFEKLDRGRAADLGNLDLRSDVQSHVDEYGKGQASLMIVATLPSIGPIAGGMPGGALGSLRFRIDDAAAAVYVDLKASAQVAEIGAKAPLPLDRVRTTGTELYISAVGGYPGCFFFTH